MEKQKHMQKDTIKLNETDNLAEIMKCNFRILNKDVKISYNKVLVKSDLEAKILYLTDDNRINSVETIIIPVMGFIDVQDITRRKHMWCKIWNMQCCNRAKKRWRACNLCGSWNKNTWRSISK